MAEKYLYGASVQGIQDFIFQTNKLREIVGASELVEEICSLVFVKTLLEKPDISYEDAQNHLINDSNAIVHAAGNIKYIFEDKAQCEKVVRHFPKTVATFAPGITISQAVVRMDGTYQQFDVAVDELERRLRAQRNNPMTPLTLGCIGLRHSRQTNMPVIDIPNSGDFLDEATLAKLQYTVEHSGRTTKVLNRHTTRKLCEKAFAIDNILDKQVAYNVEEITGKNNWIAVIHIDGNGLGQVVRKIGKNPDEFRKFSEALDVATTTAAQKTYKELLPNYPTDKVIPIRPIVLSGDDHTLICRGDLAMNYAESFLQHFEEETKILSSYLDGVFTEGKKRDCLTACAGIAYVKSSYPFYYAYELAERLCDRAKKDAKNEECVRLGKKVADACLMFHKVRDSFNEDFNRIVERELTPNNQTSFEFGPYYMEPHKNRWTIKQLQDCVKMLEDDEGNTIKSSLRRWISAQYEGVDKAKQKLDRIMQLDKVRASKIEKFTEARTSNNINAYSVYDVLELFTIGHQETKTN